MLMEKHYKAIAKIIRDNKPIESDNDYSNGKNHAISDISLHLADYFTVDNPKFNRQKFYDVIFKD